MVEHHLQGRIEQQRSRRQLPGLDRSRTDRGKHRRPGRGSSRELPLPGRPACLAFAPAREDSLAQQRALEPVRIPTGSRARCCARESSRVGGTLDEAARGGRGSSLALPRPGGGPSPDRYSFCLDWAAASVSAAVRSVLAGGVRPGRAGEVRTGRGRVGDVGVRQVGVARFAPWKFAPLALAPVRLAFSRFAPWKSTPEMFAPLRFALVRFAPWKFAPAALAPVRLAPLRFAPWRFAFVRVAFVKLAPLGWRPSGSSRSGSDPRSPCPRGSGRPGLRRSRSPP